jgi:hypothetical protein
MTRRLTPVALAIVCAIGCGKSGEEEKAKAAEQAAQAAKQAAPGTQGGAAQVAQGLQQMAQGMQTGRAPAQLVAYEELKALLPEPSGWERKTRGEQTSMGLASISHAEGEYTSGDTRIKLEITDAALAQMLLAPLTIFVGAGYSERNDDGYTKSITIAGNPGFEKWEKESRHAEVTAIVGNRFIVTADGRGVDGADPVRKVVEAVNLAKLASMK